jgi:hypothetical protein
VTCRDIDGMIISSLALTSPDAIAHIAGCERCQSLAQAMGQPPRVTVLSPSPAQLKKIKTGILADLKPVKPLAPRGVRWFALLLILAIVVSIGSGVLGIAGWLALSFFQKSVVFTSMALAACLLAFSAGDQIVPGTRLLLSPVWLVTAVVGVMTGIFAVPFRPHREPTFVSTGLVCLRIGLECAIPCAVASWLLLRRGAILRPMPTGATTGALAGLSGLMVLEIFCPNLNEYHILVWHLGAALISAAGGVVLGSLAERFGWRRTRRTP